MSLSVRSLFVFDHLNVFNLLRTAWRQPAGKELTYLLAACAVLFYAVLIVRLSNSKHTKGFKSESL